MSGTIASLAGGATKYMGGAQVTVGADTSVPGEDLYGWFNGNANGSDIDPNSFAATGNAFNNFYWISDIGSGVSRLLLSITGALPNYGWEAMRVGSNSFSRTSATYTTASVTQWYWDGVSNPFGTTVGAGVRVTWT